MNSDKMYAIATRWAGEFARKNKLGAHLVEDLTQEAALAYIKAEARYKPEKGPLNLYAKMWAFALMRKYMNRQGSCVSYQARQPFASSLVAPDNANDDTGGEHVDLRTESGNAHELAVARQALGRCENERQYVMVTMRMEGHSLEEIGAAFGVSRETARLVIDEFGQDMIR